MASNVNVVARKERLEMLRDGRFRWAAAITLVLLLASLAAGWRHYRTVRAEHAAAQQASRAFWLGQGEKNPHSAAHYGVWAFKPRLPLSFADRGVEPYVGQAVWLEAHKQNEFRYRPAADATAVQRMGEWTAAAVLQLLVPLLVIVLVFPAFAGEREQGTLRLLASSGASPRALALGKASGVAQALGLLLAPAAVAGGLALALAGDDGASGALAPRAALLAAAYALYLGVFLALSLAVSARAGSPRAALLVLLAFWTANSLVAPRLAADVARTAAPTPSAFAFQRAIDRDLAQGIDGHTPDERTKALERETLARYGVTRLADLPLNFDGVRMQAGEEHGNQVFDHHYGALYAAYARQDGVQALAALAAPLIAVRQLSMGLAGTDVAQHRAFAVAAESYRRMMQREMNGDIARRGGSDAFGYKAGAELWARIPDFHYEAPGLASVLAAHRWSLVFLLAWVSVGAAAVLRIRALRLD